jgi:hypothetical protein
MSSIINVNRKQISSTSHTFNIRCIENMISSTPPPMSASPRPTYETMPASPSRHAKQQQQYSAAIPCYLPQQ